MDMIKILYDVWKVLKKKSIKEIKDGTGEITTRKCTCVNLSEQPFHPFHVEFLGKFLIF